MFHKPLQSKLRRSSAEAGEHNREALCCGNCNTKYSTESAIAIARLICPSREDYKARPRQCPAEPLLILSKGQARELPTLLNSSSRASYQAQQVFLFNHSAALHSGSLVNELVYSFSITAAFKSALPLYSYSVNGQGNKKGVVEACSQHEHPLVFSQTQYHLWEQPDRGGIPRRAAGKTQHRVPGSGGEKHRDYYLCARKHAEKHPAVQRRLRGLPAHCGSWGRWQLQPLGHRKQVKHQQVKGSYDLNSPLVDRICI